jgi:hypothetical protein
MKFNIQPNSAITTIVPLKKSSGAGFLISAFTNHPK